MRTAEGFMLKAHGIRRTAQGEGPALQLFDIMHDLDRLSANILISEEVFIIN